MSEVLLESELPGLRLLGRGKVRDIYDLDDRLLIITTDRISAFDCILPTGIPDKGRVLTSMSRFWFDRFGSSVPNHLDTAPTIPPELEDAWPRLSSRSMIVKKAQPFPVECVARGYISGSAWKEYSANLRAGRVENGGVPCCGLLLPTGLRESSRLPEPIFTPSTKATVGHDENISAGQAEQLVGAETLEALRRYTLDIYTRAADYAAGRGILIADTKFEFGLWNDQIILVDEVLTPDSSRFWDAATYEPGRGQPSYDKQFVRDYLETLDWDKTPPAPPLPEEIAEKTSEKYREAYRRLVGADLST